MTHLICLQVSQGHALLAEVLQLSSSLPPALQPATTKFAPILFDFRYFRDPDAHDQKVEASRELTSLDEEFREVCHGPCMHALCGILMSLA